MKNTSLLAQKLVAFILLGMLLAVIPTQALEKTSSPPSYAPRPLVDPYFTWEDQFDTEEHIDPALSHDYEVKDGTVGIKNTYAVWTDPAWTRLKPITLTNTVGAPLTSYAVHLTIAKESAMRADYGDIRFKYQDFTTTWLDYWVEAYNNASASVWIRIPTIPTGNSMLYLFYGNPAAQSQSDYYSVFTTWHNNWPNDERVTYHTNSEGAWDPEVEYGIGEFLVLWEEGQAYFSPHTFGFKQEIRGSLYGLDGAPIMLDTCIFNDNTLYYRNENPSAAFGDNTYFVAWEHYDTTANPSAATEDIKARTISRQGGNFILGTVQTVCSAASCQADAFVTYDSVNHRFCVLWEDGRNGVTNYNVYGRLYDTAGNPIGSEKTISSAANNQCEPWAAYDPQHQQYLIVYEEGLTADTGPFSIKGGFFNQNLDPVGTTMTFATGLSETDYNFPAVGYCELMQRFLVAWNDGDISDGDWYGNIWARVIDTSGNIIKNNFILKPGNFIRTDITPYLPSTFLVSFDSSGDIWGKMVTFNGTVFPYDIQMSASNSSVADWAEMTVGDGHVFIAWEDIRIDYPYPWNDMPDVFGNIWQLNIPGSSDVTAVIGPEKQEVLTAQVTSKTLAPFNLVSWHEFNVDYSGSLSFNILSENGSTLIAGASNGEDLSGIDPVLHPGIRAQATLSRANPSYTPLLDSWSIVYVGSDDDPPETIVDDISGTLGQHGWYISNVRVTLSATDGQYGSGVNHTYFRIDQGAIKEYDAASGIRLPQDATGDPNTLFGSWNIRFWSVDYAGNVESPQGPVKISIDKIQPYCSIWMPSDGATIPKHGGFWVQVTATDNGSGIDCMVFDVGMPYANPVTVTSDDPPGSGNYKWYCNRDFTALQFKYILAQVYDVAGNMYEDTIFVHVALPVNQPAHGASWLWQLLEWIIEHSPGHHAS